MIWEVSSQNARSSCLGSHYEVSAVAFNPDGSRISGSVSGSKRAPYSQSIMLNERNGRLRITGYCTCPIAFNQPSSVNGSKRRVGIASPCDVSVGRLSTAAEARASATAGVTTAAS